MLDVIECLERMGEDSALRYASSSELVEAFAKAGMEAPVRAAIGADDRRELESLLGAKPNIFCGVMRPDEEEEEKEDEREDEGEDEDGEDDDKRD